MLTMLKAIKKAGKRKSKWNLERIKRKTNHVKVVMEQKFSDSVTGSVEDNWKMVKEPLLDIPNKMEIAPRKQYITKAMIKKRKERRIAKTTDIKVYRRLNNQLRSETHRAKDVCMEDVCKEIMYVQMKGKYDRMYQKTQELRGRTSKAIGMFGIKDKKAT